MLGKIWYHSQVLKSRFLFTLGLFVLLIGCMPAPGYSPLKPWSYTDLRLLDPVDSTLPGQDLLALYTRTSNDDFQIRLDFLDHSPLPDYDLYIAIDHLPAGQRSLPIAIQAELDWDTLIIIPTGQPLSVIGADGTPRRAAALSVWRDSTLDTLVVSLKNHIFQPPRSWLKSLEPTPALRLQVFLTPAGSQTPADQTGIVSSKGAPPPPTRVLFAFWDSYPAYTPVQSLRRWDGAHTGPYGGRHGLGNLLRAAQAKQIPLTLLDLKNPAALSALDYNGGRQLVDEMLAQELLILPEYLPPSLYFQTQLPAQVLQKTLDQNLVVERQFHLTGSPFIYSPSGALAYQTGTRLIFTHPPTSQGTVTSLQVTRPERWRGQTRLEIPVAQEPALQVDRNGLTMEVRRALAEAGQASTSSPPGESPLLVLGGSLPASAWGDPQAARAAFHYLVSRPWIRVMGTGDLLNLPATPANQPAGNAVLAQQPAPEVDALVNALLRAPQNNLSLAAWQAFQASFAPIFPAPAELASLRAAYLGDVWMLLEAAQWVEQPYSLASCQVDLDRDGQPECVLANPQGLAFFEIQDAILRFYFVRTPPTSGAEGVHQLVGPSSQFISGLSDSSTWSQDASTLQDPAVYPGIRDQSGENFRPTLHGESLVFTSQGGELQIQYHLTTDGLKVVYHATTPRSLSLQIPLAIDPWQRFETGWPAFYQSQAEPTGWSWSSDPTWAVQVQSQAKLQSRGFLDSLPWINATEDPNRDYPAGHFLPFPVTLLEVTGRENLSVHIGIKH